MNLEKGAAYFDEDRTYRYALSRIWSPERPTLLFIGLNPSTADESRLDPTLRRVIGFARREGCGGVWMGNLFAFRATIPRVMLLAADPVGPENDKWLLDMARWCSGHIVVGWGAHGAHRGRGDYVRSLLQSHRVKCLGTTASGQPRHPLYLAKNTPLTDWGEHA